jgi:tripartite-type tricarboxylate transporter receptor subunit TctC
MRGGPIGLGLIAAAAAASACAAATRPADAYPSRPVRVVVSASPGAVTDTQARLFSQLLSETYRQQFIVDNRPGAGGLIGFQTVAKAAPDGHTLLAVSPSLTTVYAFQDKPTFHPVNDFDPVSLLIRAPFLIVAHPSFPAKSMPELIGYATAKPRALTFGLGGTGSIQHLAIAWIAAETKTNLVLVSYKGIAPAVIDLIGGQIQATMANIANVGGHVKAGKLRALALTGLERSAVFPELRTISETTVPGFDVTSWQGWIAPKGTPAAIVNRLNAALAEAARLPEVSDKIASDGARAVGSTPAEFGKVIASEASRWRRLVDERGLRSVQ